LKHFLAETCSCSYFWIVVTTIGTIDKKTIGKDKNIISWSKFAFIYKNIDKIRAHKED